MDRIVVVGCGSIGLRHARQLSSRKDVVLELCDVDSQNLSTARSEVGQAPSHSSFAEMLATSPQMVLIATPPALHANQVIAALESGVHVLCEKPMSDNLDDARRMRKAADLSGCVLDFGFLLHFHPALRAIKEAVERGRFGKILHIHWHIGTYETLMRSVTRHQANAFGALALDYAHQPDLLYWWLQENPALVHATGIQQGNLPLTSNPNLMSITMEYDSQRLSTLNLNFVQHPGRSHCEVIGDEGWAFADLTTNRITWGSHNGTLDETTYTADADSLIREEQQAFIDVVRGLRAPESPASSAIQSMFVVDAAICSLRSGDSARLQRS